MSGDTWKAEQKLNNTFGINTRSGGCFLLLKRRLAVMAKYRKKPVVVEAIKLGWDTWNEICDFVPEDAFGGGVYLDDVTLKELPEGKTSNAIGLKINTLEGVMLAQQGDYIIKGVKGEFYPCKPDIFEQTYEPVD
jgi:hypothetical protein